MIHREKGGREYLESEGEKEGGGCAINLMPLTLATTLLRAKAVAVAIPVAAT